MCIKDEFAELVDFEVDGNKRVNSQKTSGARERELARTPMRGVQLENFIIQKQNKGSCFL